MSDINFLINFFEEQFEAHRNPEYALRMKAYMKDKFEFYGIQSPIRKQLVSKAWKIYKITDSSDLYKFGNHCWSRSEREWQYAALDIMGKCNKLYDETTVPFAERLISTRSWWDTVDWIASHIIGGSLMKHHNLRNDCIDRWMSSGNIWLQRTCLIFQLKYREQTDFELMSTLILDLKGSKDFFIRKGAGWALRQYSKFRPDLVKSFIEANPDLPNLTKREGLKYC